MERNAEEKRAKAKRDNMVDDGIIIWLRLEMFAMCDDDGEKLPMTVSQLAFLLSAFYRCACVDVDVYCSTSLLPASKQSASNEDELLMQVCS